MCRGILPAARQHKLVLGLFPLSFGCNVVHGRRCSNHLTPGWSKVSRLVAPTTSGWPAFVNYGVVLVFALSLIDAGRNHFPLQYRSAGGYQQAESPFGHAEAPLPHFGITAQTGQTGQTRPVQLARSFRRRTAPAALQRWAMCRGILSAARQHKLMLGLFSCHLDAILCTAGAIPTTRGGGISLPASRPPGGVLGLVAGKFPPSGYTPPGGYDVRTGGRAGWGDVSSRGNRGFPRHSAPPNQNWSMFRATLRHAPVPPGILMLAAGIFTWWEPVHIPWGTRGSQDNYGMGLSCRTCS
eukprot:gene24939-biopygen23944